jgi:hypothetical protein
MARYRLQVHCNACGGFHLLPIACSIENGPPKIKSIQDAFGGKAFPEWLTCVSESMLTCPATGRRFIPDAINLFWYRSKTGHRLTGAQNRNDDFHRGVKKLQFVEVLNTSVYQAPPGSSGANSQDEGGLVPPAVKT